MGTTGVQNRFSLKTLYNVLPLVLLAAFFTALFAPGMMSSDSLSIYQEALTHSYSDHHPPMMAYLWHYLNEIHQGPLLMYLFNMMLLWSSIYVLSQRIFINSKKYIKYFCLLIPFIPQVMVYAGWIWKDIIFSFGYGLLSMYLAKKMLQSQRITLPIAIIFFTALIYFSSVKYQAQFILPIICYWFFYVQNKCKFDTKIFFQTIITGLALIVAINTINHLLVTKQGAGSSNSWQYVKIYDLAGMSVNSNEILMPRTLLTNQRVSLEDIRRTYGLAWEPLIQDAHAPFRTPANDQERELLLSTWQHEVMARPFSYLQHRLSIWTRGLLLSSPGKLYLQNKLINHPMLAQYLVPLASFTAFIYLVPFMLFAWVVAIRALRERKVAKYAQIVLFLQSMGLVLLLLLLFKSLAADPRYIYFCVYLFMLAVPFALQCFDYQRRL